MMVAAGAVQRLIIDIFSQVLNIDSVSRRLKNMSYTLPVSSLRYAHDLYTPHRHTVLVHG